MQIREAQLGDLPRLLDLWEERQVLLQQADARFVNHVEELQILQQRLLQLIDDRACTVLIAEHEGEIAGFIAGEVASESMAKIRVIALDAHKYYAGVGRRLFYELRDRFKANGIQRIVVMVPRYHAVEQAFWRALGAKEFNVTGEMDEKQWKIPRVFMWMML